MRRVFPERVDTRGNVVLDLLTVPLMSTSSVNCQLSKEMTMQTLIMIERLSVESIQSKQGLRECDSTFLSDKSDLIARKNAHANYANCKQITILSRFRILKHV